MTAPTSETDTPTPVVPEPAKTATVPEPTPPAPVEKKPVTPKATDELTNDDNWRANSALWEKRSKENYAEAKAAQEKATAAEARTTAQTEQMAAIAKALGLTKEGEEKPDPEALTKALSDRMHNQESRLKAMLLKEAVDNAATEHDADARGLRDSVTFQSAVAGLDPDSADYAQNISTAVKAAVEKNPRLKSETKEVVPPVDPSAKDTAKKPKAGVSGGEITAGTGATPITEAMLKTMSPDEIAKAMTEGRLAHLL